MNSVLTEIIAEMTAEEISEALQISESLAGIPRTFVMIAFDQE